MPTTVLIDTVESPARIGEHYSRLRIGHARVHLASFSEVLDTLTDYAASAHSPAYVVTPNAQHIVLLEDDPCLREIYANASLVVPDGASLLLAARLLGRKFQERVTGIDLFQRLCSRAAQTGLRVFLLGGQPGSAERAASKLKVTYPSLIVAGTHCPAWGFEKDAAQLAEVASAIRAAKPHIVFVALGAPKQEYWIYQHGRKLGVPLSIGIGGSFEMVGGIVQRAPKLLQKAGLEWAFRLVMEPTRLWKRYTVGNAQFLAIVIRQMLKSETSPVYDHTDIEWRA